MITGHVDQAENGQIRGWAVDRSRPGERLLLDVFSEGRFLGQVIANGFRDDLKSAGIGDGYHGFRLLLRGQSGLGALRHVEAIAPVFGRNWWPDSNRNAVRAARFSTWQVYLAATFARSAAPLPSSASAEAGRLRPHARLFEPQPERTHGIGGRTISAYQDYVRHRYRVETEYEPSKSETEYARFLGWYLDVYGASRGTLRIPLRASDIAWLNERQAGGTNFRHLFARRFDDHPELQAIEWSVYNAAAMGLEDVIEANASLDLGDAGNAAGLRLWLDRHPVLRHMPTRDPVGMKQAAAVLCLFASKNPALLGLIDGDVRQALLGRDGRFPDDISRFWNVAAEVGTPGADPIADIRSAGFEPGRVRFASRLEDGSRLEAAARGVQAAAPVDVQVFGPFSKALGVGTSCRRLAAALAETGYTLRLCDFTLDYPNASAEHRLALSEPGPARVNVVHLNFEEVPKIFAYGTDVFSEGITIVCPYTELSELAPEQVLGCDLADHVWAATRHIAQVVGERRRCTVIGSAIEPMPVVDRALARTSLFDGRVSARDFLVLTTCDALSGLSRKNIVGSLRAFLAAFPNEPDTKLVIKTHSLERTINPDELGLWSDVMAAAAKDPRIVLMDQHLETAEYRSLQASADVLLSLHRAEGLGYNVLEAMAAGVACIVTDYSGTRDFCTSETAYPVGYRLVPIRPEEYPFTRGEQLWAEPDHGEAVSALRELNRDENKRRALGDKARALMEERFSRQALAQRLTVALQALIGPATKI